MKHHSPLFGRLILTDNASQSLRDYVAFLDFFTRFKYAAYNTTPVNSAYQSWSILLDKLQECFQGIFDTKRGYEHNRVVSDTLYIDYGCARVKIYVDNANRIAIDKEYLDLETLETLSADFCINYWRRRGEL